MAKFTPNEWSNIELGEESPLDYATSRRDRGVVAMVATALQHGEAALAFQPVYDAQRPGAIRFYEGLIRVFDETGRIIPARDFIAKVEKTELGRLLDSVALDLGLQALRDCPELRLSVNMSIRSVGYPRWMRQLEAALNQDPSLGTRLILEISEPSILTMPDLVQPFMAHLRDRKIAFALDDFGAGLTSFDHLNGFGFHVVKYDERLCQNIHLDQKKQVVFQALDLIARHENLITVAKNVDQQADATWLKRNRVTCLQGNLFAAPTLDRPWRSPRRKTG